MPAGIEFVAESRLTIVADVIGRTLLRAGRLDLADKPFVYQGRTAQETFNFQEFEPRAGNLNLTLGTVGIRFNPVRDFLRVCRRALSAQQGGTSKPSDDRRRHRLRLLKPRRA